MNIILSFMGENDLCFFHIMDDFALENAEQFWQQQVRLDSMKNRERRYQQGRGPCNIFILDTSSSLGEDGFIQMKETFCTIMDEYDKYPETDENVAVIICGRTTAFKYHYSNQYHQLKHCIDDVQYGGPSPLAAAFLLSLGAIVNGAGHVKMLAEFHVFPRVILISAGRPTDFTIMSEEEFPLHGPIEVKDHFYQAARKIGRHHPIFCIPVSKNPDMANLRSISALSRGGKIVYPHEAKQFAKYSDNMRAAAIISYATDRIELNRGMIEQMLVQTMPEREFTELDKDDISDICSRASLFSCFEATHAEGHYYFKQKDTEKDSQLIPLGSRVSRGPDWKWENQDNNSPGTVVGYSKDVRRLVVHWDSGKSNRYRYGTTPSEENKFDVLVCEDPRKLDNELIDVGCLVRRGRDWECGNMDGGSGSIGAVYRVKSNGIVYIRWQNGNRHDCRYGFDGKFDLILCDPFSSEVKRYLQEQRKQAQSKLPENMRHIYAVPLDRTRAVQKKVVLGGVESTDAGALLKIPKGRYFKNDINENNRDSDVETDYDEISASCDKCLWKDQDGSWNHYPRKINDKIVKSYKKNPRSTVVISLKEQLYRVVLEKNKQINLKTREESEVKFVKSE